MMLTMSLCPKLDEQDMHPKVLPVASASRNKKSLEISELSTSESGTGVIGNLSANYFPLKIGNHN